MRHIKKQLYILLFMAACCVIRVFSVELNECSERPRIWVSAADRPAVLKKISTEPWAISVFEQMKEEVDPYVDRHREDPDWILGRVPLTWGGENYTDFRWEGPHLIASGTAAHPTVHFIKGEIPLSKEGHRFWHPDLEDIPPFNPHPNWGMPLLNSVLNTKIMVDDLDAYMRLFHREILELAVESSVLYWITGEERYAAFSADILHVYCRALAPMNSGVNALNNWGLVSDNHLLEARWFSSLLPIIYDFVCPYIETAEIYDPVAKKRRRFDRNLAQGVFRTYVQLALDRGIVDCNWVVFEASSLVNNALALDDPKERNHYIDYFLNEDTAHQQSMKTFMNFYTDDDVWFESFSYANSVNIFLTYLFNVVDCAFPEHDVVKRYPVLFDAIHALGNYQFPNGSIPLQGDSRRRIEEDTFVYEAMHHLAVRNALPAEQKRTAGALKRLMEEDGYDRSAKQKDRFIFTRPLQLLWFEPKLEGAAIPRKLPRTDTLKHAGLVLQRNGGNRENGMMVWQGGAHHVHAHASGINMELYGAGEVVGVDAGYGKYDSEIQNQYYRLYAAHNTVIVNNASRGLGGWENIGQETVQVVSMEPHAKQTAVSPNCSFATTAFTNGYGSTVKHAPQQRTMALVRTSPTTGYCVDVFRSRAESDPQFHDYLYHNISDKMELEGVVALQSAPDWFGCDIGDSYRQPGTRWFEMLSGSEKTSASVSAHFYMTLNDEGARTRVWFPGGVEREYASVLAPPSRDAFEPYATAKTPTLVVRKVGEAWAEPFVAVYEIFRENSGRSVQEVTLHALSEEVSMLQVESETSDGAECQRIFYADREGAECSGTTISFKGRFAVCSEVDGELEYIYFGDAVSLQLPGWDVAFKDGRSGALNVSFKNGAPSIVSEREVWVRKRPGSCETRP